MPEGEELEAFYGVKNDQIIRCDLFYSYYLQQALEELDEEEDLDVFIIGKGGHALLIKKIEQLLSEIIAELNERFGTPKTETTETEDESISKFYLWEASLQSEVLEIALNFYLDHGDWKDNDCVRQNIEVKISIKTN